MVTISAIIFNPLIKDDAADHGAQHPTDDDYEANSSWRLRRVESIATLTINTFLFWRDRLDSIIRLIFCYSCCFILILYYTHTVLIPYCILLILYYTYTVLNVPLTSAHQHPLSPPRAWSEQLPRNSARCWPKIWTWSGVVVKTNTTRTNWPRKVSGSRVGPTGSQGVMGQAYRVAGGQGVGLGSPRSPGVGLYGSLGVKGKAYSRVSGAQRGLRGSKGVLGVKGASRGSHVAIRLVWWALFFSEVLWMMTICLRIH